MKAKIWLVAAAVAALAAAPAHADGVSLGGDVAAHCELNWDHVSLTFSDLDDHGNAAPQSATFTLYCNQVHSVSFVSTNGRLLNIDAPADKVGPETGSGANSYDGSDQFFAALDYSALDDANTGFTSTAFIDAGVVLTATDQAPQVVTNTLHFTPIPLDSGHYLTAGHYQDTFSITVTPTGL
jgi:hypothetical protein